MNISIIIPTYNRHHFIKRALVSVYAQSHMPDEVIIVDDGSTDNTSEIQTQFPHAKYIYQENAGVSSARNLGIKHASNEWIAFLDSDDVWDVDKLKNQVAFHKQNPHAKMSYTDELWIRDGVEVKMPKKFKKHGGYIFEECLSHCIIAPSSVLVHKELLNQVKNEGSVFDESLEVCEDYDLWLRLACGNFVGLVDEKLITKYAGHEDQLSFKHWGMDRFRVIALEKLLKYEFPSRTWELEASPSLCATTRKLIVRTLLQKYTLLLKGAIKHDKMADIKNYEGKIKYYEQFN